MRSTGLLRCLLCCSLLSLACGDDSSPAAGDAQLTPDQAPLPDAGVDQRLLDAAPPGPDLPGARANIYRVSPLEDHGQTSEVDLAHLTDPEGYLTGAHAAVYNCLNESGGEPIQLELAGVPITGTVCKLGRRAVLVPETGYLHILPPAADTDGGNAFAEVMMYHHITTLHDHFTGVHGLTHLSGVPLRAIVNLQGYVDLLGLWVGLPNAMYVPADAVSLLEELFGSDLLAGQEAILFGYNNLMPGLGQVNFSFDATVIYHEYTHYAIGGDRFTIATPDALGLDPSPPALHEALADYFPGSFLELSQMGRYALGEQARDLGQEVRCPEHLVGESHQDGQVASSAFWAARQLVGPELLDTILWQAALSATASTTFAQLAQAVLAELNDQAPSAAAAVQAIFTERGLLACERLVPHVDFEIGLANMTQAPPGMAGKATAPQLFPAGVPAYLQYWIDVAPQTQEIVIEYQPVVADELGLGGAMGDASVALQPGAEPITYSYDSGQAISSAWAMLKGDPEESGYRLTLSGSCVRPGRLVFQLINHGLQPASLIKVKVTQNAESSGPLTFDSCKE